MLLATTLAIWVASTTLFSVSITNDFVHSMKSHEKPFSKQFIHTYIFPFRKKVSSNASNLPSNALSLGNSENNFNKIELIDVKCDKNENGMHVTIQFSQPFEGIIYSQGYFNDPKCRYAF